MSDIDMKWISRSDARAMGLSRYYTGNLCHLGHDAQRLVSNKTCVICGQARVTNNRDYHRQKNKEWRAANPERFNAAVKAWTEANPERRKAISDKWYAANRDRHNATNKVNYMANRDQRLAQSKARYATDPERHNALTKAWYSANKARHREICKAWAEANPVRALAIQKFHNAQRRALKKRQTPSWADLSAIKALYLACPPGYHVDHIVPIRGKAVSGLHIHYNLQYLLAIDNIKKGNHYV